MQKYKLYDTPLTIDKYHPMFLRRKQVLKNHDKGLYFEVVSWKPEIKTETKTEFTFNIMIVKCRRILKFYKNGKRRYERLKK